MNRRNLLFSLNIGLIICVSITAFALPVISTEAQTNFQDKMQSANKLEWEKARLKAEMDKVKGDIFDLMGEMISMISETLSELTLNFNKYFKLVPEIEEETATSTATTTEEIVEEEEEEYVYTPTPDPDPMPAPPPVTCLPLSPSGPQTYSVTTKSVPTISQININPFDIVYNSVQTVTVNISDANGNPVTSVTGLASTDSKTFSFNLALIEGEETNGTWQGSWTLKDSVCNHLSLTVRASSDSGTSEVTLSLR